MIKLKSISVMRLFRSYDREKQGARKVFQNSDIPGKTTRVELLMS